MKKASASALGGQLPEGSKVFYADEAEDYEQVSHLMVTCIMQQ